MASKSAQGNRGASIRLRIHETMPVRLPSGAARIANRHPQIWAAYERLGAACADAGPLDARTRRLVKLALAVGSQSEGAVHSHTRRSFDDGLSKEELLHVAMLAIPSIGLAKAVAAMTWIEDVLKDVKPPA
jgi:alkylhydroperoxidase/carboxymuconolactone decarboxylase family protein YurZ